MYLRKHYEVQVIFLTDEKILEKFLKSTGFYFQPCITLYTDFKNFFGNMYFSYH